MYTLADIATILAKDLIATHGPTEQPIRELSTDSRTVVRPARALFIALRGDRLDGHRFLSDAYAQGVRAFLVERPPEVVLSAATILIVRDSWQALQHLSAAHRATFSLPVIGITGSNGKTIVKEWLYQLLHPQYRIVRSPRSYNSQLGVPLSLWQIQDEHQLGIFEAGISRKGEMSRLAAMIRPDIGVFTTLGAAHDEGFADRREKVAEKMRLFAQASVLIYPKDQKVVHESACRLQIPLVSWSWTDAGSDLYVHGVQVAGEKTSLTATWRDQLLRVDVPFTDPASLHNAVTCWAVLLYLALPEPFIRAQMAQLTGIPLRLEVKDAPGQCRLIMDGYNADLTGLESALSFLRQQAGDRPRTLILSDLQETGLPLSACYTAVAQLAQLYGITRMIGVGQEVRHLRAYLPNYVRQHYFATTADLCAALSTSIDFHYEAILLKGARAFAFERVRDRLTRQVHRTVLEVNLSAMAFNLRQYQRSLAPDTRIMVMVKAAAYGSGSREVARLLQHQRVDYLGVAYADEGAALRRAGVDLPILVLNPEGPVFDMVRTYRLEPQLFDLEQATQWEREMSRTGTSLAVHLNIDTGMHRLGFPADDLQPLLHFLEKARYLQVVTVFTHLAVSDTPDEDAYTRQQVAFFLAAYAKIVEVLGYRPWRHVANTHAISRFPQYQMDMVRLGIGLYGVDHSGCLPESLQTVVTFRARIAQIKSLPAGATVGYGRAGKALRAMRLATVTAGYADGLPRTAGNGHYGLYIRGRIAPTVGQICMDVCMVDVTDIPDARAGDEVELFGPHLSVSRMAEQLGTIPYELLAGISARVRREYLHE